MGAGSNLPRERRGRIAAAPPAPGGPIGAVAATVASAVMPTPTCTHVVLACMDFRFVPTLTRFLEAEGIAGDADLLAWPGGGACLAIDEEREHALAALALATRLHRCERVLLVSHEDCMRLGGSAAHADPAAERAALADYLRRAVEEVRASIPALTPRTVVLQRSGEAVDVG